MIIFNTAFFIVWFFSLNALLKFYDNKNQRRLIKKLCPYFFYLLFFSILLTIIIFFTFYFTLDSIPICKNFHTPISIILILIGVLLYNFFYISLTYNKFKNYYDIGEYIDNLPKISLFIYSFCSSLTVTYLSIFLINIYFDKSNPHEYVLKINNKQLDVTYSGKHRTPHYHHKFIVSPLDSKNSPNLDSIEVPESIFNSYNEGDNYSVYEKKGYLGISYIVVDKSFINESTDK